MNKRTTFAVFSALMAMVGIGSGIGAAKPEGGGGNAKAISPEFADLGGSSVGHVASQPKRRRLIRRMTGQHKKRAIRNARPGLGR